MTRACLLVCMVVAVGQLVYPLGAAAADTDCAALAKAIDRSQRVLSKLRAETRGVSSSAARKEVTEIRIQQELLLLQTNVAISLKACPALTKPVSIDAYSRAAFECETAVSRAELDRSSAAPLPACDIDKWLPD
jgi:hypothetical protein